MAASDDILNDLFSVLHGDAEDLSAEVIRYGDLRITIAPKEGKAITLLADQLFSPSLLLAELIELNRIDTSNKTIIELGAGCALPTLLMATRPNPPSLAVATDYPDRIILDNLKSNIEKNKSLFALGCQIRCTGYSWGTDVSPLLDYLPAQSTGYDMVILSDLLHFDSNHEELLFSVTSLLARTQTARVLVAAGKYTKATVCDQFLALGEHLGLAWEKQVVEEGWKGSMHASFTVEQLSLRKANCHFWIGRWQDDMIED